MSRVSKVPLETRAEAAAWLARLRADDRSSSDERAFRAWLAQDSVNAAGFEAVTEMWEAAGALNPLSAPARTFVSRRQAMVAGVSGVLITGGWLAFRQAAYAGVYETAVGEQRHVVLEDGTQVFLDAETRIRTLVGSDARSVDLEQGRCDFHVARGLRPFLVNADGTRVSSGQGMFDVQREGSDVSVILLQGSAEVSGSAQPQRDPCLLKAGERLTLRGGRLVVDRPNLDRALAWQTGQAIFENDSLGDAVREMNHYSVVKLEAGDAAVARMRISGVYRVGDNVAFARSVAALLPVGVEISKDRVRLVPVVRRAPA